jgi:hypothetical protein
MQTEIEKLEYINKELNTNYTSLDEDVGRVIHDGGKIRCRKITILN